MFRRDPRQLLGARVEHAAVGQAQALGESVEHHHAAQRIGQGGDQQAVVAARDGAAHRAGGVAAQAVGDQPLLAQVGIRGRIGERSFGQHSNQVSHSSAGSAGRMTTAAWAGIRHSPPPSTGAVPAAAVDRIFARPFHAPDPALRRRQQRLGSGIEAQVGAQVDQQQPVVSAFVESSAAAAPHPRGQRHRSRRGAARETRHPRAAGGAGPCAVR